MAVVTIRGTMGSGAPEIGRLVADKLQTDHVDREIIEKIAERLKGPKQDIKKKEMPPGSLGGRILESLRRTYPSGRDVGLLPRWEYEGVSLPRWKRPVDDARYLTGLESVIKELAKSPSVVIRGRGSQFILKDYPGALHVLVVSHLELRVKRIMESTKLDEENAKNEIEHFDSSRREFIKRYFRGELENPLDYDLVINTEHITYDNAVSIIIGALPFKDKTYFSNKQ